MRTPTTVTPEAVVRSLAEPARMRVLAAVALGARTPAQIAASAPLSQREILVALHRLRESGLVTSDDLGLRVAYEEIRQMSQDLAADADDAPGGDAPTDGPDSTLRPFVRKGRLATLPAAQGRRRRVLAHIADNSFTVGIGYDEPAVNDKLRVWCDGGEVDHVTLRRYLIDTGILVRANGIYTRPDKHQG